MQDRWTALITAGLTSALSAVSGVVLSNPWLFWPSVAAVALVGLVTCATLLLGQLTGLVDNTTALLQAVQRLKNHRGQPPVAAPEMAGSSADDPTSEDDEP